MAGFGALDQAIKPIQTVEEYIQVGMEITKEVALDFMENNDGEADTDKFRKTMLDFIKMEQGVKDLQEAVQFVKQQPVDADTSLEELFDQKLDELARNSNESLLLQHNKIQELNQKMWDALHPDEAYSAAEFGFPDRDGDEIEMTQEINTRCPYTGKDIVNPVRNKLCGHSYDRDGIMAHIKNKKRRAKCPLGGCSNDKPLEEADLEENKELKRYIDRVNRNKH